MFVKWAKIKATAVNQIQNDNEQKQPPVVFSEKRCSGKFCKIHRKTGLRPVTLLKRRLWHRCFPVNFAKFSRTPFLQNTSGQLLLNKEIKMQQ